MTILSALAERYERLAARGEASVLGFAPAKISFTIVLGRDGKVVQVDDERAFQGKKARPKVIDAPEPPKRSSNVAATACWDKTSYVFGRSAVDEAATPERQKHDAERTAAEHTAFKERNTALLSAMDDDGARALLSFLRGWLPENYDDLPHSDEMLDQNVAFRLEGERRYIHDSAAVRAALAREADAAKGRPGVCLVTGENRPIARLHPSIKGVPGSQSSGAALVSFNQDAFTSYGKEQGDNAPVSEAAAFAYATALNDLLSAPVGADATPGRPRSRNRISLGADTVVFWAETEAAEQVLGGLLDPAPADERTETAAVRKVMEAIEAGRPLHEGAPDLDPATRAFVLGLSPNVSRLSVRFWLDRSLGDLAQRFGEHWRDLRLEPAAGPRAPALWALLYELAPKRKGQKKTEAKDVPAHLAGELTRAILTGGRYPRSLLSQTLMRVRADGGVSPLRIALIKAVLSRNARKTFEAVRRRNPEFRDWKDPLVSLDRDETNAGYRLGRLFSVLDAAQYAALGKVNAGVKERFFAAASATPGHVFPLLLRSAQNHLSSIRKKGHVGRAIRLDKEISEILEKFNGHVPFPHALSLDDQGRFVIGFYHEGAELRIPRAKGETIDNEVNDTEIEPNED